MPRRPPVRCRLNPPAEESEQVEYLVQASPIGLGGYRLKVPYPTNEELARAAGLHRNFSFRPRKAFEALRLRLS